MAVRAFTLLVVALLLAVLAGCTATGGDRGNDGTSPFTGQRAESGPVLAVKTDNAAPARPHTGLDKADIVYVERVEGGLSRLIAIYSSDLPDRAGPVRSARESDLELLEQFGDPALAYSGVQRRLKPLIEEASLFAVAPEQAPAAYERSAERPAPYNLYVLPEKLLAAAPEASEARDIGFRFGAAPARGGERTAEHTVSYPSATFSFTWSPERQRWLVGMDGSDSGVGAATVVVQHVTIRGSQFHDRAGNVSPYTETVGSGTAEVLRDGRRYAAEWSRPTPTSGTEFTTPDGDPMRFARGPVWVVYTER